MQNSLRHVTVVFSFASALVATYAHAIVGQPGTLDTTWNGTGKVITLIGGSLNNAYATILQPDGKVLLAGACWNNNNIFDFCAARYLTNGTLDTTWNGTGTVITPVGSSNNIATAMTQQPDGKVLLAGRCSNGSNFDMCAARYLPNGTLDTTWNATGKVITSISSGTDAANAIALQPDGKVLLAGSCYNGANNDFCVARYLASGTLDTTWNGTGTVITPMGIIGNFARATTLQPDGKVLLAGNCSNGTNNDFCAARYLPDGTLDTTWNGTGKIITPIGSNDDFGSAMTLQPDGKVLLAGFCSNGANNDFCALRYLSNGTLDTTWNSTGKVITPIGGGNDFAYAMTLLPDGKVLLAGYCNDTTISGFCLARYDGGPNTPKTLTEYVYNPLNYYFLTSRDTDKALLDATPGWARTGQSFSSLSFADPGSIGINRYYFDQVAKNQTRGSHFYTLVDSEKIALGALNPTNQPSPRLPYNEGIDSYAFLPVVEGVGGRCAAGQTPVYRTFRGQFRFPDDPNHRFTISLTLYSQLVAQGWDGEGVKMCAPN